MQWILIDSRYPPEQLSFLNEMLSEDDPRSAKEQLHDSYFGGWRPMHGFTFCRGYLKYPGDPAIAPFAATVLRDEAIYVYPGDWVLILQPDGVTFEVARMD